ncbi:hypothetical protein K469DRAFT_699978 [Zopfia rhizophila CBS 207.26]|uniref:Uncharacterized protein n=1 Tax=Zopfia rhizophila CBS 207.26 TaxID=1314779 RepID=A0A6A6EIA8_9PEZI|nr:hypothetical protein K469DRAFT_699978 [Zopfia rhizophila CBS 207.26]
MTEAPQRGPDMATAALQASLALHIPAQFGFKVIFRASFWFWSVQYALSCFECALLLSRWLRGLERAENVSPNEREVKIMVEQIIRAHSPHVSSEEVSQSLPVAILLRWGS